MKILQHAYMTMHIPACALTLSRDFIGTLSCTRTHTCASSLITTASTKIFGRVSGDAALHLSTACESTLYKTCMYVFVCIYVCVCMCVLINVCTKWMCVDVRIERRDDTLCKACILYMYECVYTMHMCMYAL